LLTGLLSASLDDYFRLRKYFLQILAGVTNNDIVVDPNGYIAPGTTHSIPFLLNEADIGCTTLLMTGVNVVDLALQAPDGTIIDKTLRESSGSKTWDEAVLRAIDRTGILPRDVDGRVRTPIVIGFRPND